MNVQTFIKHIKKYTDYEIISDSGWEGCGTDIDAALISHKNKDIILLQNIFYDVDTCYDGSYEILYGEKQ